METKKEIDNVFCIECSQENGKEIFTRHEIRWNPEKNEFSASCLVCHFGTIFGNRCALCECRRLFELKEGKIPGIYVGKCWNCGQTATLGPKYIHVELKEGEGDENRRIIFKEGKWYNVGKIGGIACPKCHIIIPDETDDPDMRKVHGVLGWKTSEYHWGCIKKGGKYAENFSDALNRRWMRKR